MVQSAKKAFPQLEEWKAHDTVIQKYGKTDFLTAHLDLKRHPHVIIICTISGSCLFEVLSSREGNVTKAFYPSSGDLLLLRAPGLSGNLDLDDRPFHRVSGNESTEDSRISITFRDNTDPERVIPGLDFNYDNKETP